MTFLLLVLLVFVLGLCTIALFEALSASEKEKPVGKLVLTSVLIALVGSFFFGFGCFKATSPEFHKIFFYFLWIVGTFISIMIVCFFFALFAKYLRKLFF